MATGNVSGRRPRGNAAVFAGVMTIVAALAAPNEAAGQACTAGTIDWVHQFGTAASDEAWGVAADSAGNVYVAGRTAGTLPGQTSVGGYDAFVRKYDPAHNQVWTRQFGKTGDDWGFDVTVDGNGNVYVAGSMTSGSFRNAFLRKYDTAGTELWTREFGGPVADAMSVAVDATGFVYVAGGVRGAPFGQIWAGGFDAFVRKYNDAGVPLWTRQFGTSADDLAKDVAVDAVGNVHLAGFVGDILPGQSSAGGSDIFVRQYDSSGTVAWTRQFGTSGNDGASGVAVDETGNTYVTGSVTGALPGQIWLGSFDVFLRKYDGAGGEVWTRQFGTSIGCPACFDYDQAWGVAVDEVGNVYVAGTVAGPLPGQTGVLDAFVRSYDPAGNELLTRQFGSPISDTAFAIAVGPGSVFLAGETFGALEGENAGSNDVFVARLFLRDVEPPTVSIVMSPDTLWPPDHRMVQVSATISVSDACDSNPTVTLVSVTSNEPDDGAGDGNTTNDVQAVDADTLLLRAERAAGLSGRIYTATYVAVDASGNASEPVVVTVAVPPTFD